MRLFKKAIQKMSVVVFVLDILLFPVNVIGIVWLRVAKFFGISKLYFTRKTLKKAGVMPIVDHYYEPYYFFESTGNQVRDLPSISFNQEQQLGLLESFCYQEELDAIPYNRENKLSYYYNNGAYSYGDADSLYSIIRHFRPQRIIEIGSGYSTMIAVQAINRNIQDSIPCKLSCIEPYEMPWLKNLPIELIRSKVEDLSIDFFRDLKENDILFVDSSHVIRPNGDVLHEILTILPELRPGVLIHFHDIFTPFHYPQKWISEEYRLWNEQYLLEAFLSYNLHFEILLSAKFLKENFFSNLQSAFPNLKPDHNPSSFWIRKIN